jgi:hypothetical protein
MHATPKILKSKAKETQTQTQANSSKERDEGLPKIRLEMQSKMT